MPTIEERREAARKLRETGKEVGEGALLWYHISRALGVDLTIGGEAAANVLAELIEPEPERTCHFEPDVTEIKYDENDNEIETGEPAEDCSAFECSEFGHPMQNVPLVVSNLHSNTTMKVSMTRKKNV